MNRLLTLLSILLLCSCSKQPPETKSWGFHKVEQKQESTVNSEGKKVDYIVFVAHVDCPQAYPQGLHIFDTGIVLPDGQLDPNVSISFGVTDHKKDKYMEIYLYVPKSQLKRGTASTFNAAIKADGFQELRFTRQIELQNG